MLNKGPFPYLTGADKLVDTPAYSEALVDALLAGPAPAVVSTSFVDLPNRSGYGAVPSSSTPGFTLSSKWLCLAAAHFEVGATWGDTFTFRLSLLGGDNVRLTSHEAAAPYVATPSGAVKEPVSLSWPFVVPPGSTPVVLNLDYKSSGTNWSSLSRLAVSLTPIRPVA